MSVFSQHILQRVSTFIQSQSLLTGAQSQVYVALSGGPDSVALLHLLRTLGYTCEALHCNFHLRGVESDRDQHFCQNLCQQLCIPMQVKEFDTRAYMQAHHLSLEMAARQLRYDWWADVVKASEPHNAVIALGHHRDDAIETLLMNLMRGTGIQGLTGIVARNAETHAIRPLLCLSRQDILQYLQDNSLTYVTDSTNGENDTLRNQVRNQLLPLMEQILPHTRQGISATMEHLQQTELLAHTAIADYVSQHATIHSIDGYTYQELHCPEAYRYEAEQYYRKLGYDYDGQTAMPKGAALPERPTENRSRFERFDSAKITFPLRWRRWQQADRMAPLGMQGHTKLLSDLFTNAHYTPLQKRLSWVLTDASGAILWVPGLRMSHLHRITTATLSPITIHYGEVF